MTHKSKSHPMMVEAMREAARNAIATLKPPPRQSVSQWADLERRLSSEASAAPGRWYTERTEYLRGIMDAASDPSVTEIVVQAGAQLGKTEVLLNVIGFHVAHDLRRSWLSSRPAKREWRKHFRKTDSHRCCATRHASRVR